ncbi:MAG: class I SAM-dependent methyltransferase [Spirosomataceae bacterium]
MRKSLEIYNFQKGDVIASLGAGGGVWEIAFATFYEDLTFYLEDVSRDVLNQEDVEYAIQYYTRLTGKPITAKFIPVIGTEKETNLPTDTFDKVLIINSFHEFNFPTEMLAEVKRILKADGKLFIEEDLATYEGQLHEGCNRPLFSEKGLIEFLQTNGFQLVRSQGRAVETGNTLWKVMVLEKTG